jgi:hypothetical protein
VIDNGSHGPAGKCGRLALEHDERMLIVTLPGLAQRQRRGAEPLGPPRERADPRLQLGQVAPENPERRFRRFPLPAVGSRPRSVFTRAQVTSRIV